MNVSPDSLDAYRTSKDVSIYRDHSAVKVRSDDLGFDKMNKFKDVSITVNDRINAHLLCTEMGEGRLSDLKSRGAFIEILQDFTEFLLRLFRKFEF